MRPLARGALVATLFATFALALSGCVTAPVAEAPVDNSTMVHMAELREAFLREKAATYQLSDIDPIPAIVRYVSIEELPAVLGQCLNDEGFTVVVSDGGLDLEGVPDEQREAGGPLLRALWTCNALYTVDPRTQQPFTPQQYRIIYDYYTGSLASCLQSHGIPASDPPSFTTFVDKFYDTPWTPYDTVIQGDLASGEWDTLNRDCPQGAPSSLLYGPPLQQPGG